MADEEENERKYRRILLQFMSYNDRNDYDDSFVFTAEHLAEVNADDVVAWFNYKVYGKDVPASDDRPTEGRSNSLLYYKNSYFLFYA